MATTNKDFKVKNGLVTEGSITATGNVSGNNLLATNSVGDEGGEILLSKPVTNTTISGTAVTVDVYQNKLRFFENSGTNRGYYIDITAGGASASTNLASGGGTTTNALTIGTGLSGTSFNGSAAVTIANTGVLSVNGSTGAISGIATTAGNLSQFAATTSAQLAGVISDETGSGALVFATSPTLVTPSIGVATGTSFNSITGLSSTTPIVDGTAAVGTATTVARADHVHPTPTSVVATVSGTNSADLVYGNMADNDQFRIRVGGTASNTGFVELATADDGTEPIYVRQYTGVFTTLARTATLLDGSGNTTFPGTVSATSFNSITGLSATTPIANGTAAVGTATTTARADHVHPTTGLGLTASGLNQFAATTSAQLAGVISDETGSGSLVFGTSPSLTTPTIGGAGANFSGSSSGTTNLRASAAAGTTTITLPAVTGTVVTTGDTGTVTSSMIADGTIVNADINASAAIAVSKLAASTISGVTLGNNLNTLTIGTGLSGTSYNGSSAVTVAIDSTVATLTGVQTLTNKTLGSSTALGADLSAATYKITGLGTPTASTDAATKQYVDDVAQGLHIHPSVVAATTANLTATYSNGTSGVGATLTNSGTLAAFSSDGVSPAQNDRVLVKNQTTQLQNGIYTLTTVGSASVAWVLTRATDMDQSVEVDGGDFVFVTGGSTLDNTGWVQTEAGVTIGTSSLIFTQFSGAGTYAAGNGLTLTGNTFSINTSITADLSTAQTLTNKTLTSPTLTTPSIGVATGTSFNSITGLSSTTPIVDGTAAVGTATTTARADHVHPTDTSRAATSGTLAQFAATTSAQLAGVISDETGSGALVFATSPTLVTPSIGVATGTSFNSITGLSSTTPSANGTAAVGTATTTARADHVHPTTGLGLTSGTLAQFAATTSAQLAGVISDETGSGALVFGTSPTLVTPVLGVASATSINKVIITAPATASTLTVADGKTLTASNTLTFTGTDASTVAFGTGGTVAYTNVATLSSLSSIGTVTTGTWNATAIGTVYGGTGLTSYTTGDIIYASATNTLAKLGAGTAGQVLTANGAGVAPSWQAAGGGGADNDTYYAQMSLSGGGIVTWTGTNLKWSQRVIAIPVENTEFGAQGYIDINCPTSGTITYYNASNVTTTLTCTANGIPLGPWEALYYQVTPGQGSTSDQTRFRVVSYQNTTWSPTTGWILLATTNGEGSGTGGHLRWLSGQINLPTQTNNTAIYKTGSGETSWNPDTVMAIMGAY